MKKPNVKNAFASAALTIAAFPLLAQEKAPAAPAVPSVTIPDEVTYWKTDFFDAVLAVRKCKEHGVCAEVHWVNPKDEKILKYWGDPKLRRESVFGDTTTEDPRSVCGYKPKMQFKQVAANKWQGTMDMRGLGMTVNAEVTLKSENEVHAVISKAIFTEEDTWKRVDANDPRYPKCTAPKK